MENKNIINKYQSKVEDYLNSLRVPSESVYTHISMAENYKGKFNLDKHQIKEFTKLYAEAVSNGAVFGIGEKPKSYGPLLVDLDIEITKDNYNNERLYNNEMIYEIINAYRKVSNDYLNLSNEELAVSVFEKPQPTIKKDKIKDGIHLIFQGTVVHYKLRYLIRDKVVQLLTGSTSFKNYNVDKLIDKQVVHTNCWLLPGSKKPLGQLYELKCIYDQNNKAIDITNILSDKYKMINLFSLQHKIRCEKNQTEYLEGISSELIEDQFSKYGDKFTKKVESNIKVDDDINKAVETCLLCLPINDYNDFEKWRDIALIINNELGYNGLDVLQKWSSDAKDYDKSKVEQFYKNIKPKENGLKIGTLKKKAKETNPDLYKSLFKKQKEQKEQKELINTDELITLSKINYNKIKVEFEKNNFKILYPISFATIKSNNELALRTKRDFKDVYENLQYLKWNEFHNRMMDSSFIDDWLTDAEMRTYDKIDFLPMQQAPSNIFNTFKGYEAEKIELIKTDIENSLMLKHIKHLCNNDDIVFNYFLKFIANLLKSPYNISKTAIILKSVQGCGKDTFFDWFGNNILGSDYYINTDKAELIFGRFNSCIENKILIVMNETNGKDTFSINENIKCAITAKENTIEHKGKAPYKNTNNIAYVFLTNNENPVKVPHDDRRFTGFECNNLIANNFEYFTDLNSEIKSKSYDRAFFNYLMDVDVKNYDFTNNRPITSFYNNMKELNTPIMAKFFENMIDKYNSSTNINFTASSLYDSFNNFIKENNFKVEYTSTKFGLDVKNYEGIEKKRTKTGNQILINIDQLKQHLTTKYKIEFSNEEFVDDTDDENSLDI